MKHLPLILFNIFALIVLFFSILTIIYIFPPAGSVATSVATKLREADLQRFKEKFDIQITLYNGVTLPQLIPSVEGKITEHEDILKGIKYFYVSALYKGIGVAYLTVDITSSNNSSLGISDQHLRLRGGIRNHLLLCAGTPVMWTDEANANLDYQIKDILVK